MRAWTRALTGIRDVPDTRYSRQVPVHFRVLGAILLEDRNRNDRNLAERSGGPGSTVTMIQLCRDKCVLHFFLYGGYR
jgi:hypothetical protein